MKELAIEFLDVSHHFRVFSEGRMASLKEWLIRRVKSRRVELQHVVALDNVSFEVGQGQALGLIGHNGAGKSSLLRIAAGILQPRAGTAIVRGLVAPILELGFGFEQELTGRENIVFNGAILGRSRQEMNERMEEIVSFAELDNFIDQPIRTYSTGMVARLAFSIATAVDAQILLLDEVLSVGDEKFQRKCAERIDSFRNNGVTILFVSHALPSVEMLCDKAIWLQNGRIQCEGETDYVIDEYRRWMSTG